VFPRFEKGSGTLAGIPKKKDGATLGQNVRGPFSNSTRRTCTFLAILQESE